MRLTDNMLAGLILLASFLFAGVGIIARPEKLDNILPFATAGMTTGAAIAKSNDKD